LVEGDIRDPDTMRAALVDVDAVIALAALVGDAACALDVKTTRAVNVDATRLLCDACLDAGVPRIVFASTCSVYGQSGEDLLTEQSPLNPVSLYAQSKVESEGILLDRMSDLNVTILRLATVFGLSSRMRFDLLVNTMTLHAVRERRVRVFGGDQWRPNVHVQDVADALIATVSRRDDSLRGQIVNVGDAALNFRVRDVARLVCEEVSGVTVEEVGDAADARNYRVGFDKARRLLGFRSHRSLRYGIQEVARAVRAAGEKWDFGDGYSNVRSLERRLVAGTVPGAALLGPRLAPRWPSPEQRREESGVTV
jgi:nucleoside-diphosphate-sugar epimerase